jgi:hypothetical protein
LIYDGRKTGTGIEGLDLHYGRNYIGKVGSVEVAKKD